MSDEHRYTEITPVSEVDNSDDTETDTQEQEKISKDFVPHYLPTYRISSKYYAVPIIVVVILSGLLAYITYFVAGIDDIDGGYLPEGDLGPWAGIINGIIFTLLAAGMAFLIIFVIRKLGMGAIKYISNGADVMAPGVVGADPEIQVNEPVWVRDEKNLRPLVVGISLMTGPMMVSSKSEKAVRSLHYVGDKLWNIKL